MCRVATAASMTPTPGASGARSIGIVGSGAMARALGRLLHERGWPVVAVAGRSRARTAEAAAFIGSGTAVEIEALPALTDRILIAVTDDAVSQVATVLAAAGLSSGLALHTSGAHGPEALQPLRAAGVACGVLHPLQTVPRPELGARSLPGATYGIAGDAPALTWARALVEALEGQPLRVADNGFAAYHAAAVMGGNAIVAVLDVAVALMAGAGVAPDDARRALAPLARATLENVLAVGPVDALTGPVSRGDAGTVSAHLRATASLTASEAALYRAASHHLLELAVRRGLPAERADAVRSALASGGAL